jgi:hypothetical protein
LWSSWCEGSLSQFNIVVLNSNKGKNLY